MLISFATCQRMKVSVKTDTTVELISRYIKKADILEGSKTLFLPSFLLFLFLVNKGVIQVVDIRHTLVYFTNTIVMIIQSTLFISFLIVSNVCYSMFLL